MSIAERDTPNRALVDLQQLQWATQPAQQNRARINRLFNGDPPWTEDEREMNRVQTNVNWLEPGRIAANSRYQMENAFLKPGGFFTVRLENAPVSKRDVWSAEVTRLINKPLKRSREFTSTLKSAMAQVVLHGPGASLWRNKRSPVPGGVGVDDVLVPAGTYADFSNLDRFAVYREWTWGQLRDMTQGAAVDSGWNKTYVDALLANLYKQPLQSLYQGNRWLFPEKIQEDIKENVSVWASSALARVLAWDYYKRDEATGKWNRRILLDYNNIVPEGLANEIKRQTQADGAQFLYSRDNYADDWSEVLHMFVGNCSNVAPFRYYSVRSIGYLLYGVCLTQNRLRCKMTDHIFQQLLTWFRNVSEDDRERVEAIELHNFGVIPDGVSLVTADERHTADWNLVGMGINMNRALMAESATSFLPDIATEGQKPEMTATESLIRNNASVTLTSAVLNQMYEQSVPLYREMARRFCLKGNSDPMAKEFQEALVRAGIPPQVLDVSEWEIIPERVMGGGNKSVELTVARALFEMRGALGPQGAVKATRKLVLAYTDDARETMDLVPDEQSISDATVLANLAFGTLMQGVPFVQKRGINEVDYVSTLLQLMAVKTQSLEQLQQQPEALPMMAEAIAGLVNVGAHTEQHIQVLAQDAGAEEEVKQFQQALNGLMSQLKGYAQQVQQAEEAKAQQAGGMSPEAQAKVQEKLMLAQAQARIMEETAALKQQHKDAAFVEENARRNMTTQADVQRKLALTQADVAAKDMQTRADLLHQARQAELDRANAEKDAALKQ